MGSIFKNKHIARLDEVDSTNSILSAKYLNRNLPEGSVIVASSQTKGRGQGANKWHSEAGKNLTCSFVLYPSFLEASYQFYISKIFSLAVADLVSLYSDKVSIKWPNDIYVNDKKIAGLLIEHAIERNNIKSSILGLGLNVNQKSFPSNLPNPVSLMNITQTKQDLDEILESLTNILEYRYSLLKNRELGVIDENYQSLLYRYKKLALFEVNGKRVAGSIEGVESTGELIFKNDRSEILHFGYKEIEYVI
ncbi:MAG TPA: biotin--[acetyl-CoA-carboxylase] ligase [Bacteroidales bacterium]|nr:biotin--[acetyl-CoA-carboxylase] ligase [Bacteroidales bacterium]